MSKKTICIVLFSCIFIFLIADIRINYSVIDELYPEENLNIVAIISDGLHEINEIYLVIKSISTLEEKRYRMEIIDNNASVFIERDELPEHEFYYYFQIIKKDRNVIFYPENPGDRISNVVRFLTMKEKTGFEVSLIYPKETVNILANDFHIAAYVEGEHRKKGLIFDDIDITEYCNIGENIITYFPDTLICDGVHKVEITVNGFIIEEFPFTSYSGKISIFDKPQANIEISGGLRMLSGNSLLFESTDRTKYPLLVNLGLNGKVDFLNYSINTYLNMNDFTFINERNRYSVNLKTAISEITIGDKRILWNRIISHQLINRGIYAKLSKGVFETALFSGICPGIYDTTYQNTIDYQTVGVSTGFKHSNVKLSANVIKIRSNDFNDFSDNLKIGLSSGFSFPNNLFNLNADFGANISNNFVDSAEIAFLSIPDNLSTNDLAPSLSYDIRANINPSPFSMRMNVKRISKDYSLLTNESFENGFIEAGTNIFIPFIKQSANINLDYSYIQYDELSDIKHNYSIGFNFFNIDVPKISIIFSHLLKNNEMYADSGFEHLLRFKTNINHQFYIQNIPVFFSFYVYQGTMNSRVYMSQFSNSGNGINLRFYANSNIDILAGYSIIADKSNSVDKLYYSFNTGMIYESANLLPDMELTVNYGHNNVYYQSILFDSEMIFDYESDKFSGKISFKYKISSWMQFIVDFSDNIYFKENEQYNLFCAGMKIRYRF